MEIKKHFIHSQIGQANVDVMPLGYSPVNNELNLKI